MHFVFATRAKVTRAVAARINRAIKAIDQDASFVGPVNNPGETTTGWIERPDDGTNDSNDQRAANRLMADIARHYLGGTK